MHTINIHEAKTHLSKLVEDAAAGEEIIIAKAGKPMARLVPLAAQKPARVSGLLKGKIAYTDDFNAALPEVEDGFAGLDGDILYSRGQ